MNALPQRFSGKVAVITGGASGIGLATAQRLHGEGAAVVIASRNQARGREVEASTDSERFRFVAADVTRRDALDALFAEVASRRGRLDVLVCCAGRTVVAPFATLKSEHWRALLRTNLDSVFETCQSALPYLRATVREAPEGGAAIVNVASLDGVAGDAGMAAYSAAKAGVVNFTRSLALELARERIRVNAVSPGAIDTPMAEPTTRDPRVAARFQQCIPLGRFGRPEEIAAGIAFLAADEAGFVTGTNLLMDGGVTAGTGHPDLLDLFDLSR